MTIAEAIKSFTESNRQNPAVQSTNHYQSVSPGLLLLQRYLPAEADLDEMTPVRFRDFVARWYVEEASTLVRTEADHVEDLGARDKIRNEYPGQARPLPGPVELMEELARFLEWMNVQMSRGDATSCLSILSELKTTLPRALEINRSLSKSLRERQSAFSFPEFLTSFEEGGSSQYDIDAPGNVGAIDGFFRILRIEGNLVEAQEVISEEHIWPIIFPNKAAGMLNDAYVINLELVRDHESWQIAGCGFTYPPGTEF